MRFSLFRFEKRQNRRYNYTPRYYKGKEDDKAIDIDSRFRKYREKPNSIDFGAQWKEDRLNSRNRKNRVINRRLVYIILILILIFLWIIDFDISIFTIPFDPLR